MVHNIHKYRRSQYGELVDCRMGDSNLRLLKAFISKIKKKKKRNWGEL